MTYLRDEDRKRQLLAAQSDDAKSDDDEPQLDPDPYYPTMQESKTEPPADDHEES